MLTARLTSRGRVTIPKPVRQRLRWMAGDEIEFLVQEDGSVLLRRSGPCVRELFGILSPTRKPARSLEEIEHSVLAGRAADDERIRAGRAGGGSGW